MLFAQEGWAQKAIKKIASSISPAACEVSSLAEVKNGIVGPVLQIVRWGSGELKTPEAVIAQINALGYNLTLGETHQPQSCNASLGRSGLSA